jgi:hypothetical protein
MHSFDKLAETYGEEGAINLASLARTKLILATADKNTAEVCSNFIGFREVRETDEAYSIGASRSRDAATITPRTEVKPLVIPDDIMNLPSLHGYVKFPEGFPAARIRLLWRDYPKIAEPFLRKTDMQLAAYVPQRGGDEEAGAGGDGGPAPVVGAGEQAMAEPESATSEPDAEAERPAPDVADPREMTSAEAQADTRADGKSPAKTDDDAPTASSDGSSLRDSLRGSRSPGGRESSGTPRDDKGKEDQTSGSRPTGPHHPSAANSRSPSRNALASPSLTLPKGTATARPKWIATRRPTSVTTWIWGSDRCCRLPRFARQAVPPTISPRTTIMSASTPVRSVAGAAGERLNLACPVRWKNRSSRISSKASCPTANRSAIPSGGERAST